MARVVALFQAPWMPLVPLAQWYMFEILMLALTLPQGSKRRFYKAFFLCEVSFVFFFTDHRGETNCLQWALLLF